MKNVPLLLLLIPKGHTDACERKPNSPTHPAPLYTVQHTLRHCPLHGADGRTDSDGAEDYIQTQPTQ